MTGFDPSLICHLRRGRGLVVKNRFCLMENLEKCLFVLVDFQTKEEFPCIANGTIFHHLNIQYNDNEAKYVYELRKGRQKTAVIGGRVFSLKENEKLISIRNLNATKLANSLECLRDYKILVKKKKKIYNSLRKRVLSAITAQREVKKSNTLDLVGCSIEFLIKHLESQFTKGMSWENRGAGKLRWHIDHIKPCGVFDLESEEEQRKCFHYSNLRPLWCSDNCSRPKDGCDMFGYGLDI